VSGSPGAPGQWWGRRAGDWYAVQEATSMPLYLEAIERLGLRSRMRLLDVGCGAGLFCELALRNGARAEGIDAAKPLIEIARCRAPAGRFFVADMEALPFQDATFDAVTGFNSFQYVDRPARALAEAARVVRAGGAVCVATWGDPGECEALACMRTVGSFLPPPSPGTPGPLALSDPETLLRCVRQAGLSPRNLVEVDMPFVYPDLETALRGMLSSGPAVRAIEVAGENAVRDAVGRSLVPFRLCSGAYRLENRFCCLIADGAGVTRREGRRLKIAATG
jgi:SAM-dependent methyltransferase